MNSTTPPESDANHPNIQEILRKRREMLNRVRADLDKIGKLQAEFVKEEEERRQGRSPEK